VGILIAAALTSVVSAAAGQNPPGQPEQLEHPEKAVCRVCAARSTHGSEPEAEEVAGHSTFQGKTYSFCSAECKSEFDESPEWWAPMEFPFPVPAVKVRSLAGDLVPLPVGDGELTILDFWATWCQPCKKTMQELQQRFEQNSARTSGTPPGAGERLRIVGISIDEGDDALEKVRRYVKKQGIRYPIFLDDQESPAWAALKIRAVPTILLLDRAGNVVWRFTGPDGDERLSEALETLPLPERR
jgi:thiol-disulfide isomerase/thioredoxin